MLNFFARNKKEQSHKHIENSRAVNRSRFHPIRSYGLIHIPNSKMHAIGGRFAHLPLPESKKRPDFNKFDQLTTSCAFVQKIKLKFTILKSTSKKYGEIS